MAASGEKTHTATATKHDEAPLDPSASRLPSPPPNPDTSEEDFLFLGAFDEKLGPRPELTVPGSIRKSFDKDAFALRIMRVDYQVKLGGAGVFRLLSDSQLLTTDPVENVHAFIHYFTLYDEQARGFVRPYCLAYVCRNREKIIRYMPRIKEDLARACQYLKYANLALFASNLELKQKDLLYTFAHLERHPEKSPPEDLEALQTLIADLERIQATVAPHLDHAKLNKLIRRELSMPHRHRSSSSPLRPSPENFGRSASVLTCPKVDKEPHVSKLILNFKTRDFDLELKTLAQLSDPLYHHTMDKLGRMLKYFNRDHVVLTMELDELRLLRHPSFLLTIGRTVVTNFFVPHYSPSTSSNMVFASLSPQRLSLMQTSTIPHPRNHESSSLRESEGSPSVQSFKSASNTPYPAPHSRPTSLPSTPGQSQPVPSEHAAKSHIRIKKSLFISEEEDEEDHPSGGGSMSQSRERSDEELNETDDLSDQGSEDSNPYYEHEADYFAATSVVSESVYLDAEDLFTQQESEDVRESPRDFESSDGDDLLGALDVVGPWSPLPKRVSSFSSFHSGNSELTQRDLATTDQRISALHQPLQSSADHIWSISKQKLGAHALAVAQCFGPVFPHVVYPLLSGRCLIIYALKENEAKVRQLVNTLCLFIPGHSNSIHQVIRWRHTGVGLSDLSAIRLVGLCKTAPIPKTIERYASVLDVEEGTLRSPQYTGSFLDSLIPKSWPTNDVFLAQIHSLYLEIGSRAFLYYHGFCLKACVAEKNRKSDRIAFLNKLDVSESDVDIVEYLVEAIKFQQLREHTRRHPTLREEEALYVNAPILLDFKQPVLFRWSKTFPASSKLVFN